LENLGEANGRRGCLHILFQLGKLGKGKEVFIKTGETHGGMGGALHGVGSSTFWRVYSARKKKKKADTVGSHLEKGA